MNPKRKVLILVHTFPPFGTVGGSIRLIKTLMYMNRTETGWTPTIITLDPEINLLWLAKASHHSLKDVPSDIRIIRVDTDEPRDPKTSARALALILRKLKLLLLLPVRKMLLMPDDKRGFSKSLERAALDELSSGDYSLVYATSPPFSVLMAAARVREKSGIPLLMEIKDDWVTKNRFEGLRWHRRFIEARMERDCMRAADAVVTVTQKSCEGYRERYPESAEKFVCVPNGCDVGEYEPFWDKEIGKFTKFTMVHTGVITGTRNLTNLFGALSRLIQCRAGAREDIEFLIIGRIPRKQHKEISKRGLWSVVRNIDYVERDAYVETLVRAHLAVVVNFTDPALVPGKLYEYWGSRNKMLLLDTQESAAAELVLTYDLGDVVSPSDEDGIFHSLCRSYDSWCNDEAPVNDVAGLHSFNRRFLTNQLEKLFGKVAKA